MPETWWNTFDEPSFFAAVQEYTSNFSNVTYDELGSELAFRAGATEMHFGPGESVWDRTTKEFRLLVCKGNDKYSSLKKKLGDLMDQSVSSLIAIISAALGSSIGVASTVIAPLIAVLLLALSRVGLEVVCSGQFLDIEIGSSENHGRE